MTEPLDRKKLIAWSIKRLKDQAKCIVADIEHDSAFIEEKTALLPQISLAKKDVEKQIAERMSRVDNLRLRAQMIALCLELLEKDQS